MLSPINKIREISHHFDHNKMVENYRIQLNGDLGLNVYVLVKEKEKIDYKKWSNGNGLIKIEELNEEELKENDYVKFLFEESEEKVNFGYRQRLRSLLEPIEPFDNQEFPPIVSFYSYKGGMGRTTTLAGFAMHCAYHFGWKVLVIDCDLEAPGITNFYGLSEDQLADTNGIVEYLLNKEFEQPENIDISEYIIEVDKLYTGKGDVFIMPAGNLSDTFENEDYAVDELEFAEGNTLSKYDIHRTHYFEGLARINLYDPEKVIKDFSDLIQTLKKSDYSPDLILIDSRTGFNEILGTIAIKLSDIIVGFFREELQAKPGMHYLLDVIFGEELGENKDMVLVHSINDSAVRFDDFKETVEEIAAKYDEGAGLPYYDIFNLDSNAVLEKIGSRSASPKDYIRLIQESRFLSYTDVFTRLHTQIERTIERKKPNKEKKVKKSNSEKETFSNRKTTRENQTAILQKLHPYCKRIFGGDFDFQGQDKSFLENQFYYRDVMLNVFNPDKFLILASKGTGKTLFHKALGTEIGIQKLKKLAGRKEKYFSINVIRDSGNPRLFFPVSDFPDTSNTHRFYERFWTVYLWTAIVLQTEKLNLNLPPSKELKPYVKPITKGVRTEERLLKLINSNELFGRIEDDLERWEAQLLKVKTHLIVTYDLLDQIVLPEYWEEGSSISPLINYWRYTSFRRILPKIFLRPDLFFRVTGITNSGELIRAHSINLEWQQEEIFALLFKQVLFQSKEEFITLMYNEGTVSTDFITDILKIAKDAENQIPLKEGYLRPLVEVFFGEKVGGQGYTYDWFYRNLRNSNDTISIRPFLNLLDIAIKDALGKSKQYLNRSPILHFNNYANSNARSQAVKDYFEDLAKDKGNEPLQYIFEAFRRNKIPDNLKKDKLSVIEFKAVLKIILQDKEIPITGEELKHHEDLLIDNGIIKIVHQRGGDKMYSFAYLYKFFLGLKSSKSGHSGSRNTRRV